MNKLLLQIAAAAIVVVSFSASAVDVRSAPAPSSGGGFQNLPKSCPAGKTARIVYDQKGTPIGVVCV